MGRSQREEASWVNEGSRATASDHSAPAHCAGERPSVDSWLVLYAFAIYPLNKSKNAALIADKIIQWFRRLWILVGGSDLGGNCVIKTYSSLS